MQYVIITESGNRSQPWTADSDAEALAQAEDRVGEWVDPEAIEATAYVVERVVALDDEGNEVRDLGKVLRRIDPALGTWCPDGGKHEWLPVGVTERILRHDSVVLSGGSVAVTEICGRCGTQVTRDHWCQCEWGPSPGAPHECVRVDAVHRLLAAWVDDGEPDVPCSVGVTDKDEPILHVDLGEKAGSWSRLLDRADDVLAEHGFRRVQTWEPTDRGYVALVVERRAFAALAAAAKAESLHHAVAAATIAARDLGRSGHDEIAVAYHQFVAAVLRSTSDEGEALARIREYSRLLVPPDASVEGELHYAELTIFVCVRDAAGRVIGGPWYDVEWSERDGEGPIDGAERILRREGWTWRPYWDDAWQENSARRGHARDERGGDVTCALCGRPARVVRHHPGAPVAFARGWALDDERIAAMAADDGWLVGLCERHAALDRVVDLAEAAEALGLSQIALDRRMRRNPGAWPLPVAVRGRLRLWWLADLVAATRRRTTARDGRVEGKP
jgi:predicted DNA-binding transcriptional regulator AlpA